MKNKILKVDTLKILMLLFFISLTFDVKAQFSDLVVVEYSFIPKTKSEDKYTNYRLALNYPLKVDKKNSGYLFMGTEFNRVDLNLNDNYPFDSEMFRTINVIDLKLGYSYRLKNDEWRFNVLFAPRIASTLNAKLTTDDIFLNGLAIFTRSRTKEKGYDKPSTLILGLGYSATFGLPFPIPVIRYSREMNEHWSYGIGVPSANIEYTFNEKNSLRAIVNFDGFFANIQQPLIVNGQTVNSISLSVAVLGLEYEYSITKNLIFYMNSGYTLNMNNVLRDDNRDKVFVLDNTNAFYLRTGLKFEL